MNWERKHINTEELIVGKKKQIIFIPIGEIPLISNISSSCGCSRPKLIDNTIVVNFTPESVPQHMQKLGYYKSTKKITITYKDNTQDKLSFTSIIRKKQKIK